MFTKAVKIFSAISVHSLYFIAIATKYSVSSAVKLGLRKDTKEKAPAMPEALSNMHVMKNQDAFQHQSYY